jgi:adenine phosphoribosyltransferase
MNILLTSGSKLKIKTVNDFLNQYGLIVFPYVSKTCNTPSQPVGVGTKEKNDTVTCAKKRLDDIKSKYSLCKDIDVIIAIENGLHRAKDGKIYDVCYVRLIDNVAKKPFDNIDRLLDTSILLPHGDKLATIVAIDNFDTTAGEYLSRVYTDIESNNWMAKLGTMDRHKQITIGLTCAWGKFMRNYVSSKVRLIPDHPKAGVTFQDYMPVLYESYSRKFLTSLLIGAVPDIETIELVVGPEMRGILFGTAIADVLNLGFIPLRKSGKLPPPTIHDDYKTEYSSDALEMDASESNPIKGKRVLLVDDILATGGSLLA